MTRHPHMSAPKAFPAQATLLAAGLACLAGGALAWHLGWSRVWPTLAMPLALALFTYVWARAVPRRPAFWLVWLVLGVVGVQLAIWLPVLLVAYVGAQGAGQLARSIPSALFTAAAVGWYVARDLWGVFVLAPLLVMLLPLALRLTQRSER